MTFCPNCGTQLPEGAAACPNCGAFVNAQQPAQPVQPVQPQYNPYNNMPMGYYVKPKIPGRGAGIASMVLAIIGLVYSFSAFVTAIGVSVGLSEADRVYGSYYEYESAADAVSGGFIVAIALFAVLSILGIALGASARNKGYRNGVSTSGLVMGVIGTAIYLISIIIIAAA